MLSSSWYNTLLRLAFRKETNYWKWQILSRKEICTGNKQILKVLFCFITIKIIYLFYFWLWWVFVAAQGLSLAAASRGCLCCHVQASHCTEFSSCRAQALGAQASVAAVGWLSSCGAWAQFLHGTWNFPRPRIKPVYFALQGGFLTTGPPVKPHHYKNFVCPYINRTHNSLCCKGKYHFK